MSNLSLKTGPRGGKYYISKNGNKIPITPTPEFNKAKVIWPLEPLAIVATTVATMAPEPKPDIILERIT